MSVFRRAPIGAVSRAFGITAVRGNATPKAAAAQSRDRLPDNSPDDSPDDSLGDLPGNLSGDLLGTPGDLAGNLPDRRDSARPVQVAPLASAPDPGAAAREGDVSGSAQPPPPPPTTGTAVGAAAGGDYPLAGLLRCVACELPLRPREMLGGRAYGAPCGCRLTVVAADPLERLVFDAVVAREPAVGACVEAIVAAAVASQCDGQSGSGASAGAASEAPARGGSRRTGQRAGQQAGQLAGRRAGQRDGPTGRGYPVGVRRAWAELFRRYLAEVRVGSTPDDLTLIWIT